MNLYPIQMEGRGLSVDKVLLGDDLILPGKLQLNKLQKMKPEKKTVLTAFFKATAMIHVKGIRLM